MGDLGGAFASAAHMILARDPALLGIVLLSLRISLTAVLCAALIGLPLGGALAVARFPGRGAVVVVLDAMMGFPPVVAGLLIYPLLSRAWPRRVAPRPRAGHGVGRGAGGAGGDPAREWRGWGGGARPGLITAHWRRIVHRAACLAAAPFVVLRPPAFAEERFITVASTTS